MQFVLHILRKHLANEKKWLHVTVHDARTREGKRMATERVPQLEKAIELIVASGQTPETGNRKPATPSKPKRDKPKKQLSLWQILNQ